MSVTRRIMEPTLHPDEESKTRMYESITAVMPSPLGPLHGRLRQAPRTRLGAVLLTGGGAYAREARALADELELYLLEAEISTLHLSDPIRSRDYARVAFSSLRFLQTLGVARVVFIVAPSKPSTRPEALRASSLAFPRYADNFARSAFVLSKGLKIASTMVAGVITLSSPSSADQPREATPTRVSSIGHQWQGETGDASEPEPAPPSYLTVALPGKDAPARATTRVIADIYSWTTHALRSEPAREGPSVTPSLPTTQQTSRRIGQAPTRSSQSAGWRDDIAWLGDEWAEIGARFADRHPVRAAQMQTAIASLPHDPSTIGQACVVGGVWRHLDSQARNEWFVAYMRVFPLEEDGGFQAS